RAISGVFFTGYIFGVDISDARQVKDEMVDLLEDGIGFCVVVMASPPSLDDAHVVTKGGNVAVGLDKHGPCPSNVLFQTFGGFSTWDEPPSSPSVSDNNATTNARTGI
ncbi:hypothetical protein PAXRUDRAFT_148544, partial [Paxillus rubicundulus Ve08.2h10]